MSLIKVDQIEALDAGVVKNVATLVDDFDAELDAALITTNTGTQTVVDALNSRAISSVSGVNFLVVDSIADLLTIDLSEIQEGQLRWIGEEELVTYVDGATGNDLNSGFEVGSPKQTIEAAVEQLKLFGPYLEGRFAIEIAAGEYNENRIDIVVKSDNPIEVRGPDVGGHPNVPTVIVGPASPGGTGWGILARNGANVLMKDILFRNFSAASAVGTGGVMSYAYTARNVHTTNCNIGIVGRSGTLLDVLGGIIDGSALNGIQSLFNVSHNLGQQGQGDLTKGPIIRNCGTGFSARESATGHSDYVSYEDNTFALQVASGSRVNAEGSDFKRNDVAVRLQGGGNIGLGFTNFNNGTGNANGSNIVRQSYGTEDLTRIGGVPNPGQSALNASTWMTVMRHSSSGVVTGTTAETLIRSYTTPAGSLKTLRTSANLGKAVKITARGGGSGTAGATKRIELKAGGVSLGALVLSSTEGPNWECVWRLDIDNATNHTGSFVGIANPNIVRASTSSPSINLNTNNDIDFELFFTLTNTGDSLNVRVFEVEVLG